MNNDQNNTKMRHIKFLKNWLKKTVYMIHIYTQYKYICKHLPIMNKQNQVPNKCSHYYKVYITVFSGVLLTLTLSTLMQS